MSASRRDFGELQTCIGEANAYVAKIENKI